MKNYWTNEDELQKHKEEMRAKGFVMVKYGLVTDAENGVFQVRFLEDMWIDQSVLDFVKNKNKETNESNN